ncbi:MAG: GNAT family N-acetyltransferase [Muribaculaceae bacterium]|nr:GNAT family N-acetyltransferase [Muribaculaceae bacterium]
MTNAFNIIDATPEDAPLIAWAIMEAVGEELVDHLAGNKTRKDVEEIFTRLAGRTDSQYSYLNTRIAIAPDGTKAAICVSYDGGKLKELRRSFFAEANRVLRWGMTPEEVDALPGETCGEEFYLDSLATLPHYRGQGAARILIEDAARKATAAGLPLGLLVADHNPEARQLYESIGFRPVARRPFAGEIMTNLRLPQ